MYPAKLFFTSITLEPRVTCGSILRGMAMKKIGSAGNAIENAVIALVDSIMNIAIDMLKTGQRLLAKSHDITANYTKSET